MLLSTDMRDTFHQKMLLTLLLAAISWAGAEPVAVIVNKSNDLTTMNLSDLDRIYRGKVDRWQDGQKIVTINRPVQSPLRQLFYQRVFNAEPSKKFFKTGSPIPVKSLVIPSDMAVVRFVSSIPNAIAYVSPESIDDSVKVITILDW